MDTLRQSTLENREHRVGASASDALVLVVAIAAVGAVSQLGPGLGRSIAGTTTASYSKASAPQVASRSQAGLGSLSRLGAKIGQVAEPSLRRTITRGLSTLDRWRNPADFETLQRRLPGILRHDHDVVVVPSLSVDGVESISGVRHYEERLLVELADLRNPKSRVHLVTSEPLAESTLALMAKQLSLTDDDLARLYTYSPPGRGSTPWLSTTALEYPEFVSQLRTNLRKRRSYMSIFAASDSEKRLATELGIPMHGPDPNIQLYWGGKSGSRVAYRMAGIDMPAGAEHLYTRNQIVSAIAELWERRPELSGVVLKLDQGSSGQGNAILKLDAVAEQLGQSPLLSDRRKAIARYLDEVEPANPHLNGADFIRQMTKKGGALEAFIDGARTSPSVQVEVMPDGAVWVRSTHDQMLSGPGGLVYEGCIFPSNCAFRQDLQDAGRKVGEVLRDQGVIGRFAIDFMSTLKNGKWEHYAVDLNLRKGGTTHPYQWTRAVTGAEFDEASGTLRMPDGSERYYVATDNHVAAEDDAGVSYKGLDAGDLLTIVDEVQHTQPGGDKLGSMFHLVGTLGNEGKVGFTSIGRTPEEAQAFHNRTVETLDRLARQRASAK